jgi:hypothetical protein
MTAHALKLSLGLLFGIRNILSLGWGNNRTHLLEKKNEKNVDDHESTQKKGKNQEAKKWSHKKKVCFCQKT